MDSEQFSLLWKHWDKKTFRAKFLNDCYTKIAKGEGSWKKSRNGSKELIHMFELYNPEKKIAVFKISEYKTISQDISWGKPSEKIYSNKISKLYLKLFKKRFNSSCRRSLHLTLYTY